MPSLDAMVTESLSSQTVAWNIMEQLIRPQLQVAKDAVSRGALLQLCPGTVGTSASAGRSPVGQLMLR